MPPQSHPWFRCYVEMIGDRKVRRLSMTARWVWLAVLAAAGDSPQRGQLLIAEGVPMTPAELAEFAGVKTRDVDDALERMRSMRMVTVDDAGLIEVTNWHKRQFVTDQVTRRTRAHKERSKEQPKERSNTVPRNVPRNGTETENRDRQEELTRGGDRHETQRANTATQPPPNPARCIAHQDTAHPGPCRGCQAAREHTEQTGDAELERHRRDLERRARNCRQCDGAWVIDPDGHPTRQKCDHPETRRTA